MWNVRGDASLAADFLCRYGRYGNTNNHEVYIYSLITYVSVSQLVICALFLF